MFQNELSLFIVEDEENLKTTLEYNFTKEGYKVTTFSNGLLALDSIRKSEPDLIISDIMMPMLDGIELCKEIRKFNQKIPFIFLTSRDDEFDRILGLEIGADDYLCKPFSLRELTTRVKVLLRRLNRFQIREDKVLTYCGINLNSDSYTCLLNGIDTPLTVSEFRILESMVRNPECVRTRDQLIRAAYPEENYVSDRNIDCHIKRLRKKLNIVNPDFNIIKTVYGVGYKLEQC